ncbi:hypothetical protein HRbin01_00752 [archaeon HR01]|nr:hypothetical protein HRbin01_00752 [archaeon HR01]
MSLGEAEVSGELYRVIRCKWSLSILSHLAHEPMSFTQIARLLNISNKVLAEKLRRLSRLSLIQYNGAGLYSLSPEGYNLVETVEPLLHRGVEPMHLSEVLKCKWMAETLIMLLRGGMHPSEIRRSLAGLSWKVLSQRLGKLLRMGFVRREIIPSKPVRVRYSLTSTGRHTAYWLLTSVREGLDPAQTGMWGLLPKSRL